MLTLRQLLTSVSPGDWFATMDLTYFHVAINPDHRQFLRFAFKGMAYKYLVLPFGLSLVPRTFTKCVEAALAPLREKGVHILACLEDWALSFLGLEICSMSGRAHLAQHRVAAFRQCLAQFQLEHRLCFWTVLQLLGMMASMIAVVPLGLLKMCTFQRWTRSHWLCAKRHLQRKLAITSSCMSALLPWRDPALLSQGVF